MKSAAFSLLALIVTASGAGCSPQGPCGLQICDVRRLDCQRRTAEATACLRGVAAVSVPVTTIDREAYVAGRVADPVDPTIKQGWLDMNRGLALLKLADPTISYEEGVRQDRGRVGALYSSTTKAITLVTGNDDAFDSYWAVSLLVHEYAHALQDQAGRLTAAPGDGSFDAALADDALIEGEASILGDLATIGLLGREEQDIPWNRLFARTLPQAESEALAETLPIDRARWHFAYPFGSAFVHAARTPGGFAALDAIWAAPPISTRQVMAGPRVEEQTDGPPPLVLLGNDAEPVPPAGFVRVAGDRMGAFAVRLFLGRIYAPDVPRESPTLMLGQRTPVTDLAASTLRGDHLTILQRPSTGDTVVVWRWRLTERSHAERVVNLMKTPTTPPPYWHVRQMSDRDVVILAGDHPPSLPFGETWQSPPAAPAAAALRSAMAREPGCPAAGLLGP